MAIRIPEIGYQLLDIDEFGVGAKTAGSVMPTRQVSTTCFDTFAALIGHMQTVCLFPINSSIPCSGKCLSPAALLSSDWILWALDL